MSYHYNDTLNNIPLDYRPRLIIWEITNSKQNNNLKTLTTHECFQVMDSIAELSKPIIVLSANHYESSGSDPLDRPDIIDIILYGNSIGLKMIVETKGDKLSKDMRNILRTIGTKSIRILINDKVKESIEDGFLQSPEFIELNERLNDLKDDGFEIQLGIALQNFDEREVSFAIDYSIKKYAKGIYLHLLSSPDKTRKKQDKLKSEIEKEEIIVWIAKQKKLLPNEMYFSPQCIRYGIKHREDEGHHNNYSESSSKSQITHWCLGGKTFAFISAFGKVQICSALGTECGNLFESNFNFCEIWNQSALFDQLRNRNFSCSQTQEFVQQNVTSFKATKVSKGFKELLEHN